MGKAFEKQTKTIEDHGQKQVEALKDLKPEEQTKEIKDKPEDKNNQSRAEYIFNDLVNKRKDILNELYKESDKNNYILSTWVILKISVFVNRWILKNFLMN